MSNSTGRRKDDTGPIAVEISAEDARRSLGEMLVRVGYGTERFIITRFGKPIATLTGVGASVRDAQRAHAGASEGRSSDDALEGHTVAGLGAGA